MSSLAARRSLDPVLIGLFALGALAMRGTGCTMNDSSDRHRDAQVARPGCGRCRAAR
jgi:4-hydroxybenzoate polyprenyltransferase